MTDEQRAALNKVFAMLESVAIALGFAALPFIFSAIFSAFLSAWRL